MRQRMPASESAQGAAYSLENVHRVQETSLPRIYAEEIHLGEAPEFVGRRVGEAGLGGGKLQDIGKRFVDAAEKVRLFQLRAQIVFQALQHFEVGQRVDTLHPLPVAGEAQVGMPEPIRSQRTPAAA
jgi:hypothetical protein